MPSPVKGSMRLAASPKSRKPGPWAGRRFEPTGRFQPTGSSKGRAPAKRSLKAGLWMAALQRVFDVDAARLDVVVAHADADIGAVALYGKDPEVAGQHLVDKVQFDLVGEALDALVVLAQSTIE